MITRGMELWNTQGTFQFVLSKPFIARSSKVLRDDGRIKQVKLDGSCLVHPAVLREDDDGRTKRVKHNKQSERVAQDLRVRMQPRDPVHHA